MTRALLKTTLLLAAVLVATGCSSLNKKAASGAAIENRGLSNGEMSDIDAARSKGAGDGSGAGAAELNDPNSPLAVRVIYFDYDSSVESQYSPPSGYLSPGGTSHFIRKSKLMRYL